MGKFKELLEEGVSCKECNNPIETEAPQMPFDVCESCKNDIENKE